MHQHSTRAAAACLCTCPLCVAEVAAGWCWNWVTAILQVAEAVETLLPAYFSLEEVPQLLLTRLALKERPRPGRRPGKLQQAAAAAAADAAFDEGEGVEEAAEEEVEEEAERMAGSSSEGKEDGEADVEEEDSASTIEGGLAACLHGCLGCSWQAAAKTYRITHIHRPACLSPFHSAPDRLAMLPLLLPPVCRAVRPMLPLLCRLLLGGYQLDVRVLNSAHYGVPQCRQASAGRRPCLWPSWCLVPGPAAKHLWLGTLPGAAS